MKNYKDEMLIVSYGGGTNSVAVLIGLRDRGIVPNLIIFADTGGERPNTYEHIKIMQEWCKKNNFPDINTVYRTLKSGERETLEQECLRSKSLPSIAYGYKRCSLKNKVAPQDKFVNNWEPAKKEWAEGRRITKVIGYDLDESHRTEKNYDNEKYKYIHPLVDWGMGREECIEIIEKEGLPLPGKSSCYFCPNSKVSEIKELKEKYPELAMRAIEIEERAELTTIKGLGRTWKWKDLLSTDDMFGFPDIERDLPCGCYDG